MPDCKDLTCWSWCFGGDLAFYLLCFFDFLCIVFNDFIILNLSTYIKEASIPVPNCWQEVLAHSWPSFAVGGEIVFASTADWGSSVVFVFWIFEVHVWWVLVADCWAFFIFEVSKESYLFSYSYFIVAIDHTVFEGEWISESRAWEAIFGRGRQKLIERFGFSFVFWNKFAINEHITVLSSLWIFQWPFLGYFSQRINKEGSTSYDAGILAVDNLDNQLWIFLIVGFDLIVSQKDNLSWFASKWLCLFCVFGPV